MYCFHKPFGKKTIWGKTIFQALKHLISSGVMTCCFENHSCVKDWNTMQNRVYETAKWDHIKKILKKYHLMKLCQHVSFRKYLTDPADFLNSQVSLIENQKLERETRWSQWATRPATSSTPHWTPPSVQRTVIVWRSRILPQNVETRVDCTNAVSGGMLPFAMSAGIYKNV